MIDAPKHPSVAEIPLHERAEAFSRLSDRLCVWLEMYEPLYLPEYRAVRQSPLTKERYAAFEAWLGSVIDSGALPASVKDLEECKNEVRRIVDIYEALRTLAEGGSIPTDAYEKLLQLPGEEPVTIEEAIDMLKRENVHGPEDVDFLLGFCPKDVPPIPYTKADLQKSLEIKELTKGAVEEMLVLFVHDDDGKPLTGERLHTLIQNRYDMLNLGDFLHRPERYQQHDFYKYFGLTMGWKLITKQCIPNSKNKRHDWREGDMWRKEESQEQAIQEYAQLVDIPRAELSRPQPFEMLYAVALHLVNTESLQPGSGERLLVNDYHWSDVSAPGGFVLVGHADHEGVQAMGIPSNHLENVLGVCLAR